jgi:hypothetical protein
MRSEVFNQGQNRNIGRGELLMEKTPPPPQYSNFTLEQKNLERVFRSFLVQIRQNFGKHVPKFVFKIKKIEKCVPKFLIKGKIEILGGGGKRKIPAIEDFSCTDSFGLS